MATPALLRALVELSTCETVDALLDAAFAILCRELAARGRIRLWDGEDTHVTRGGPVDEPAAHRSWIGIEYTLGTIELSAASADPGDIELLAQQLAPLAERLMVREASQRRTIREDIDRLYERRIRDALARHDWNFSAVARELVVSRARVADVARRWRGPDSSPDTSVHIAAAYRCRNGDNELSQAESLVRARGRFL